MHGGAPTIAVTAHDPVTAVHAWRSTNDSYVTAHDPITAVHAWRSTNDSYVTAHDPITAVHACMEEHQR